MTHKKHTNGHQTPTFGSELSGFHTDIIYTLLTFPFLSKVRRHDNQRVELLVTFACGGFENTF